MSKSPATRTTFIDVGKRAAGPAGVTGVAIILLGMAISGVNYHVDTGRTYSVLNHFVSELGEVGVSHSAWAFNVGLIVGGLGILVFAVGLALRIESWFRYLMLVLGIVTGGFGTLVGVFPTNIHRLHVLVANGFFYPGLITMTAFSLYTLVSRRHEFPRWIAIPGIVAAAGLFAFLFIAPGQTTTWHSLQGERPAVWPLAALEWVAIGAVLVWVAVVASIITIRDTRSTR